MIFTDQGNSQQVGARLPSAAGYRPPDTGQPSQSEVGATSASSSAEGRSVSVASSAGVSSASKEQSDSVYLSQDRSQRKQFENTYSIPLAKQSNSASSNGEQVAKSAGSSGAEAQNIDFKDKELQVLRELKQRDREVKAHEAAHAAVGGSLTGAPTFTYQVGPDGNRYAIGGEVKIDVSPGRTPEETLEKARVIRAAANAPAEPSAQDLQVAAKAAQLAVTAQSELLAEEAEAEKEEAVDLLGTSESEKSEQAEEREKFLLNGSEDSEAENEVKEESEFLLPILDDNYETAADVFKEIYGKDDTLANKLVELGASGDQDQKSQQVLVDIVA